MAKGMNSVRIHRDEADLGPAVDAAKETLDPESAARRYLDVMLGSAPNAVADSPDVDDQDQRA